MYRKAVNYLRGQAVVEITSSAPERVVNLCAAHGIPFWDVDWRTERCFRVTTTLPGLRRLREVTVDTDADIRLLRKTGAPELWRRCRRRYVLLAAALVLPLLLALGSAFIWDFAVSGNDTVLVTGLGPVGLAVLMLAKAMGATKTIGVELSDYRIDLAKKLGLADVILKPDDQALETIRSLTGGFGVERAFDTSANDQARQLAIRATRDWGKIAFVGEGGTCSFTPSPDIIHGQKAIYGSWVTSLWKMEELVEHLVRWNIHPADLITHTFPLERAAEAYALMASGSWLTGRPSPRWGWAPSALTNTAPRRLPQPWTVPCAMATA